MNARKYIRRKRKELGKKELRTLRNDVIKNGIPKVFKAEATIEE